MTYELAKQLKDAGFPQIKMTWTIKCIDGETLPFPTLSELIEACIKIMGGKYEQFRLEYWAPNDEWFVQANFEIKETGSTPEEAVARLFISLHNKDND